MNYQTTWPRKPFTRTQHVAGTTDAERAMRDAFVAAMFIFPPPPPPPPPPQLLEFTRPLFARQVSHRLNAQVEVVEEGVNV